MKKAFLIAALLSSPLLFGADFSIGINIGPPPPPRVVGVHSRAPGPDYMWVEGYWYPVNHRYAWHDGYWTRRPYDGAAWMAPRYEGGRFFEGYWSTPRGPQGHDHKTDHDRDRDYHGHGNDHDRDHGHDH